MEPINTLKSSQIKAARALIDWSQDDLAEKSGLSIATIRKIETGFISPRGKTTNQIRDAFEKAGLEFIDPNGVRQRPDDIKIYQGPDGLRGFFNDVYISASKLNGEIVIVSPDENDITKALGEYGPIHINRMKQLKNQVIVKCLVTSNKDDLPCTSYCEYRHISRNYVDAVPFYIYDNKFASIMFDAEPSPKIVVITSPVMAKAYTKQFYSMWDKATPLNGSANSENKKGKNR